MKQKLGYLALPLMMAAAFTTQARADGETIAVFTKNQTNPFFQTVRVGADNMAKQLNAKALHYIPTKPDSIPEQLSQIEDVVVKKPSAIVFTPVDYKAMVPGVEKINDGEDPRRQHHRPLAPAANSSPSSAPTITASGSRPRASCSRRWAARATSSSSRASRARSPMSIVSAASTTR